MLLTANLKINFLLVKFKIFSYFDYNSKDFFEFIGQNLSLRCPCKIIVKMRIKITVVMMSDAK